MNVTVVGTGYVGLVVGACLAEAGNDVFCADVDKTKISQLRRNQVPIYEPGLELLIARNQEEGRLRFTPDVGSAVERANVVFIAVGTPPGQDGSTDVQHVLDVARTIGEHIISPKVIITKSTVPVGTTQEVRRVIADRTTSEFHVCSNPEFLKEGSAIADFMKPDRVVIGLDSDEVVPIVQQLYAPFVRTDNPMVIMDIASAELTKYAANAMLATRISFMNEMAELCEQLGADVDLVRRGIGSDPRIGKQFLFPGPGYGGSCLPKDVRALAKVANEHGVALDVICAVRDANERYKQVLFGKLKSLLTSDIADATIAVWGLAFKAETDDVRESPSIPLIESLLSAGARVRAHDPKANEVARTVLGEEVEYLDDAYDTLVGADALVVVTEWMAFRNPDFDRIKSLLGQAVLVDGRNLYDPKRMERLGFNYASIGRRLVK